MNKFWFAIYLLFAAVSFSLTSCTESEEDEMEEYDISSTSGFALLADAIEEEEEYMDSVGQECFVITFPIEVINPDNSIQEIATAGDLESYYEEWEDQYEEDGSLPTLVYPIVATLEDGTVQSLESDTELRELLSSCYDYHYEDDEKDEDDDEDEEKDDEDDYENDEEEGYEDEEELNVFLNCFDIVFPVQLAYDMDTVMANSVEELIVIYTEEGDYDYDLIFPLDLIDLSDNSSLTVTTEEELETLEEACEDAQG